MFYISVQNQSIVLQRQKTNERINIYERLRSCNSSRELALRRWQTVEQTSADLQAIKPTFRLHHVYSSSSWTCVQKCRGRL